MKDIALYIHIPFCSTKCKYCAFSVLTDQSQKEEYLFVLKQELTTRLSSEMAIKTIYFGGGTPSTLTLSEVHALLTLISSISDISLCEEISFEVNPEHVTQDYIEGLKDLGITRVSMGVQSLNDHALALAGRNHNTQQALDAMQILLQSGISWNADLILGLPGQAPEETLDHLETIHQYYPTHFSVYFLSIEAGTEFSLFSKTDFPQEKAVMDVHQKLLTSFKEKGYIQYEISNWALPDHESKHNLMYWKGQEYIGVGLGASSYRDKTVFNNYKNMNLYLQQQDMTEPHSIQKLDIMDEWYLHTLTGLRLLEGISFTQLTASLSEKQRERLTKAIIQLEHQDLLTLTAHLALTPKGRLYADFVTEKLWKSVR